MAKIDRGEGTLGKLVNDNTAHNSLTEHPRRDQPVRPEVRMR